MLDKSCVLIVGGMSAITTAVILLYLYSDARKNVRGRCVPGLRNLGNTCFLNSLLQGLASSRTFVGWVGRFLCCNNCLFLRSLAEILIQLNEATEGVRTPVAVVKALRRRGWALETHMQQDVHELLNVFYSTWSEEMATLRKSEKAMQCIKTALDNDADDKDEDNSDVVDSSPCEGQMTIITECSNCSNKSSQKEEFCTITLNLNGENNKRVVSLEECFRQYLQTETIPDSLCGVCSERSDDTGESKKTTSFLRSMSIHKYPVCLILTFQRMKWLSTGRPVKLVTLVEIPELLDLDAFAFLDHSESGLVSETELDFKTQKNVYQLQAVIIHHGLPDSGHFITYRRSLVDRKHWLAMSDAFTSNVSFDKVSRCQAYMVFYEKLSVRFLDDEQYLAVFRTLIKSSK